MPGVIIIPDSLEIGAAISDLALVVECATTEEMQNVVLYSFSLRLAVFPLPSPR